jgi:hypothetical protein
MAISLTPDFLNPSFLIPMSRISEMHPVLPLEPDLESRVRVQDMVYQANEGTQESFRPK